MRVAVVDDQFLTREGVIAILRAEVTPDVTGYPDGSSFVAALAEETFDVVVLDVRMPPTFTIEGVELAGSLRATHPGIGILVLSQHAELEFVESVLTGKDRAIGYILKDSLLGADTLSASVHRVAAGEIVVDPVVVQKVIERRTETRDPLTTRERDVLAAVAEGLTNTGISKKLFLSERTVESHIQHLFEKLGLAEHPHSNRRVLAALRYMDDGR
ncbi:response regulator transcription factor [Microbacterium sp.]|uniref:response regulator transcription factor n=1 Tax=Microbacterium sp. TaxID=51671 RepID=UPI003C739E51